MFIGDIRSNTAPRITVALEKWLGKNFKSMFSASKKRSRNSTDTISRLYFLPPFFKAEF